MDRFRKVIEIMNLKVKNIDNVPESYSSEVCKLVLDNNERVILKIPYNKNKLLKEYKTLELVKNELPVARIIDFWDGNEEIPGALLLSYIEGRPPIGIIDKNLAYQMGELLGKIHVIQVHREDLGSADELMYTEKDLWWRTIREWFENCIDDCKETLDHILLSKSIELFYHYYENLPEPDHPSIVHMDFRPGNILIYNSKISGIVDFESARVGSADIDFTKMKIYVWDLYAGTKEEFIKGYQNIRPLPDLDRTLPFYLLFNAFAGVSWCIKRGKGRDNFCRENMLTLKKLVYNKG